MLKSWAVPQGPSTDPREKRLAVAVEDHALDYADFEGTIGDSSYGAGAVIVWYTGPYRNRTEREGKEVPMQRACKLADGHVVVELEGRKLRGRYALTRTGMDGQPGVLDPRQGPRRGRLLAAQPGLHAAAVGAQRAHDRGRRRRAEVRGPPRAAGADVEGDARRPLMEGGDTQTREEDPRKRFPLPRRRTMARVRRRTASARQRRLGALLAHPLADQAAEVREEPLVLVRPGRSRARCPRSSASNSARATQSNTSSSTWDRREAQKSA